MSLPGVSLVTVEYGFVDLPTATGTIGRVRFYPAATVTAAGDLIVDGRRPIVGLINPVTGLGSVELPATDDPDLNPTLGHYKVVEPSGRTYPIVVPVATEGPLQLVELAPAGLSSPPLYDLARIRDAADYDNTVSPTAGQAVLWNGSKYAPGDVSGSSSLSDLDDVDVTGAAPGRLVAVAQADPLTFELIAPPVADLPEHGSSARTTADATAANLLGRTTRYSTAGGAISQALPAASPGRVLAVGWDAGTAALTLTAAGADVIGSAAATTLVVPLSGEVLTLHCTTTGRWRVTSGFKPQASLDTRFLLAEQVPEPTSLWAPKGPIPRRNIRPPVTIFAAGHGWSKTGFGTANLNDTSDFILGTQSVTAVTDGAGGNTQIERAGMSAIDVTGKHFAVWIKIGDTTKLGEIVLDLGSSNFANSASLRIVPTGSPHTLVSGEWQLLTFTFAQFTNGSGTFARNNVTDIRIKVKDNSTGTLAFALNGFALVDPSPVYPNGVVSIQFDDTWESVYDLARPKLDQHGFPATMYAIADSLGTAGRFTMTELLALQDVSGWEIAGHAYHQAVHNGGLPALSPTELRAELRALKAWLIANGFRGADHFAYPGGQWNPTVEAEVRRYFSTARTVASSPRQTPNGNNLLRMRVWQVASTTGTGTLQTDIDTAYAEGNWMQLVFHNITVGAESVNTDYQQSKFNTVIDYIAAKGIPVRTVTEVLRGA